MKWDKIINKKMPNVIKSICGASQVRQFKHINKLLRRETKWNAPLPLLKWLIPLCLNIVENIWDDVNTHNSQKNTTKA